MAAKNEEVLTCNKVESKFLWKTRKIVTQKLGGCIGKTSQLRATVAKVNLTSDKTLSLKVLKFVSLAHIFQSKVSKKS